MAQTNKSNNEFIFIFTCLIISNIQFIFVSSGHSMNKWIQHQFFKLTNNQSDFYPGDSTDQPLAIAQKIYSAFESIPSLETRSIFLDFSEAFDRVWDDSLLFKFENGGISTKPLTLMRNFCMIGSKELF